MLMDLKIQEREIKMKIKNYYGKRFEWKLVVDFMDDALREKLHHDLAPCSEQVFFDTYCKAHLEKFGEEFEFNKLNPQI